MSRRSAVRTRIWANDPNMSVNYSHARMAEWSKAVDLRPTIIRCEGSNPSSRICFINICMLLYIYSLSITYLSAMSADGLFVCHVCRRLICLPTAYLSTDGLSVYRRLICLPTAYWNIQSTYIGFTYYNSILHILKYVLYNRISVFTHLVQLFIFKGVLEFSILDIYFLSFFHYSKVKLKKL